MRHRQRLFLLGLLCAAEALAADRLPGDACLDARDMLHSVRVSATVVTVATSDGAFRLDLDAGCELPAVAGTVLLSADGRACGGPREFLQNGGHTCAITTVRAIPFTEYTRLSRVAAQSAGAPGMTTLDPVEVVGARSALRGFGGTTEYCFNPRFLRSWHEEGNTVVVETSPRRAGGNRYYRVELASKCTDLAGALALDFRSGAGIGLICANPGDKVHVQQTLTGQPQDAVGGLPAGLFQFHERFHSRVSDIGCEIAAVYPVKKG